MLRRMGFAVTLVLLARGFVSAEPALVDHSTLPPQFCDVTGVDLKEKTVTFERVVFRPVFQTVEREVVQDGMVRKVVETQVVQVPVLENRTIRYKQLRAVYPSGDEVPAKTLADIKRTTTVVISTEWTGNVSQRFAKLLHPETILLLGETEKVEDPKDVVAPPSLE